MTSAGPSIAIHASAVAWAGRGILVLGGAGSGKSTLVAQLLAEGAYLVADDLVRLDSRDGVLHAIPNGATGLIELRGSGIFRIATTNGVPVNLCVELTSPIDQDRLPKCAAIPLVGTEVPVLRAAHQGRVVAGQVLMALCARRTD